MAGVITLTTDFGLKDHYLGAMKGAILSINPGALLVDISHQIGPGNILEGALILAQACRFFPEGTIHVGVVDPGVGGKRKPLLIETEGFFFVGPDNGLFAPALDKERVRRVIELKETRYFLKEISSTFHGRDIFGPVAAHLSLSVRPDSFGPEIRKRAGLKIPSPLKKGGIITGQVLYVDTFGNLLTNIKGGDLNGPGRNAVEFTIKGRRIRGLRRTYSEAPEGGLAAIVGSSGYIEIAANMAKASDILGVAPGEKVLMTAKGKP